MSANTTSLLLAVVAVSSGYASDDPRRLAELHKATLDSYRQLRLRLETVYTKPVGGGGGPKHVDWVQDGEDVATSHRIGGESSWLVWRGGNGKSLTTKGTGATAKSTGGLFAKTVPISPLQNPWCLALFRAQPLYPAKTFADLLDPKQGLSSAIKIHKGADGLVRLSFNTVVKATGKSYQHEVAFDPSRNYLVAATGTTSEDYSYEGKIHSFQEPAPGFFFPKEAEFAVSLKKNLISKGTVKFQNVRINEPVRPEEFDLRFPRGTSVVDQVKGAIYTTDEDEKPVAKTVNPLPVPAVPRKEVGAEPAKPNGWPVALIAGVAAAIAFLAGAACLLWFRRVPALPKVPS